MADISQIKLPSGDTFDLVDNTSGYIKTNIYNGTCASAAEDITKIVTCSDFTELKAGAAILVTFSTTNSAAAADLMMNVNGTGAKKIQYINNGTRGNLSSAGYLKASTTYLFVYDGTYWVAYFNYNTTYSSMIDAEITAGTGTTARTITPARLKTAVETWAPVTDVEVDGASVVTNGVAEIDLSNKIDTAGIGLTKTGTTLKAKLNSESSLGTLGTTDKLYPVGVDSVGKLCTNIPWDMGYECLYTFDENIINSETITTSKYDEENSFVEGSTTVENYVVDSLPEVIKVTFNDGNTSKIVYCNGKLYNDQHGNEYAEYGSIYDDELSKIIFSSYYPFEIFFQYSTSDDYLEIYLYTEEEGNYILTIDAVSRDELATTACFESAVNSVVSIPTKVSDLTNDSGYLTLATLPIYDGTVV